MGEVRARGNRLKKGGRIREKPEDDQENDKAVRSGGRRKKCGYRGDARVGESR